MYKRNSGDSYTLFVIFDENMVGRIPTITTRGSFCAVGPNVRYKYYSAGQKRKQWKV